MSKIKPLPIRQSLALAVLTLEAAASVERPAHGGHTPVQRELLGAAIALKSKIERKPPPVIERRKVKINRRSPGAEKAA